MGWVLGDSVPFSVYSFLASSLSFIFGAIDSKRKGGKGEDALDTKRAEKTMCSYPQL